MSAMASVWAVLFFAAVPPLAVLLVAVARAHLAGWPPFMQVHRAPRRKCGVWAAPEQREHELRVTPYRRRRDDTQGGGAEEEGVECVFCLSGVEEGAEVRELRCRHVFHRACLDRWLAAPPATCPLCRSRLLTERSPPPPPPSAEEEEDLDVDSDLVLLMAYVHGSGGWFWSP